jgi:hypothetical protein
MDTMVDIANFVSERYTFAKFQESLDPGKAVTAQVKAIPTNLTLFIFGFLYQLVLVYDSLRLKNTIQVLGLCMYNGGMLIYASIQYDEIQKAIVTLEGGFYIENGQVWNQVQPYLVAVPCIIALFSVLLSVEAWKLYDEFAWTIYKHISADLRMRRRFLTYQVRIYSLQTGNKLMAVDLHCSIEV